MVAARPASDVDVLAQLDVALRAEDGQPPVTPGAEAIRGEPVHANVAGAAVAAQHHVAEILQARVLGMGEVRHLRRDDLGRGGAGEEQELVGLV